MRAPTSLEEMPCELREKDAKIGKQGCREVLGYQQISGNKPGVLGPLPHSFLASLTFLLLSWKTRGYAPDLVNKEFRNGR